MKNFKVRKGPNRAYIYKNLFLFSIEFDCFQFLQLFLMLIHTQTNLDTL